MIEQVNGVAAAAAKVSGAASPNSTTQASAAKVADVVETSPISPRLRFDAVSGVVVTEFLKSGSGAVQNQTPSAAVLAYLRVGLEADGRSKTDGDSETPSVEA